MEEAVSALDLDGLRSTYKSMKDNGMASEVLRMKLDNNLHQKSVEIALANESERYNLLQQFLNFVFQVAKEDLCSRSATVAVIQDVFDIIPISQCEKCFSIVENNLQQWKSSYFFESCRNLVLRMCNDLLKRLSRTVNTSFCGQILVLLARALPLCEKSGLNLASRFNTDNVTNYETEEVMRDADMSLGDAEEMETGEIKETRDVPVDYALYVKFWQLQTFFSSPSSCYEKGKWRLFQRDTTEVLDMLASHKLERTSNEDLEVPKKRSKKEADFLELVDQAAMHTLYSDPGNTANVNSTSSKPDSFVAKYLTSQKLLQLQLNDSQFRRYFLVQCLIIYQYLLADVKSKDKSFVLNDEQIRFVVGCIDKCYQLLCETHPKGEYFAECIRKILEREREWSEWKNKNCEDFTQMCEKERMGMFKKRPKAKYDPSVLDLGNPELTKLWNINPDMLSACEDKRRKFAPNVADFLRDPLEELDPKQQVEDQYKTVNDEAFQWRATRLLVYNSPIYFQLPSKRNEVISAVGPFLEEVIKRTALTIPEFQKSEDNNCPDETSETNVKPEVPNVRSEALQNGRDHESLPQISTALIKELSPLLAKDWTTLAEVLGVDKTKEANHEPEEAVRSILNSWRRTDAVSATVKKLGSVLLSAGIFNEQIGVILKKASKENS